MAQQAEYDPIQNFLTTIELWCESSRDWSKFKLKVECRIIPKVGDLISIFSETNKSIVLSEEIKENTLLSLQKMSEFFYSNSHNLTFSQVILFIIDIHITNSEDLKLSMSLEDILINEWGFLTGVYPDKPDTSLEGGSIKLSIDDLGISQELKNLTELVKSITGEKKFKVPGTPTSFRRWEINGKIIHFDKGYKEDALKYLWTKKSEGHLVINQPEILKAINYNANEQRLRDIYRSNGEPSPKGWDEIIVRKGRGKFSLNPNAVVLQ